MNCCSASGAATAYVVATRLRRHHSTRRRNLTYYDAATGLWYLQTDAVSAVEAGARGRDSVRLHSRSTFDRGLFVMEVEHIPAGCGTWPAWWLTNDPWPTHGELAIIEQIHGVGQNNFVGHTAEACDVPAPSSSFLGSWKPSVPWVADPSTDCTLASNAQGCAANLPPGTFGAPFNAGGGGAFALVWDGEGARMYFWSAACGGPPPDLAPGAAPQPASWGLPMARFDFSDAACPLPRPLHGHQPHLLRHLGWLHLLAAMRLCARPQLRRLRAQQPPGLCRRVLGHPLGEGVPAGWQLGAQGAGGRGPWRWAERATPV